MPQFVLSADSCTNPSEYTIDRRCYVTDKQKQQKPYNATVGLIDVDGYIYCTGTLGVFMETSKTRENNAVLITAKHCTDRNYDGTPDENITIRLQDGRKLIATLLEFGTGRADWVIYRLDKSMILDFYPVYASEEIPVKGDDVSVVGHSGLKIMSDSEIAEFQQKYFDYLIHAGKNINTDFRKYSMEDKLTEDEENTYIEYGVLPDGALRISHPKVQSFIKKLTNNPETSAYINDIMKDNNNLKVSNCRYLDENDVCQAFFSDSGGPWFDDNKRLFGISSVSYLNIGGTRMNHARAGNVISVKTIYEDSQFVSEIKKENVFKD